VLLAVVPNPETAILASDSREYLAVANNMIKNGVYSSQIEPPYHIEHNRTPGYPALLMPMILVFGSRPIIPIVLVHIFLGTLAVYLAGQLGRYMFSEEVGVGASLIAAISPISIIMGAYVYTEVFFSTLLIGSILALVVGSNKNSPPLILTSGLLLGLAALTRPIMLPLLPLPLVALALRMKAFSQIWKQLLICALGMFLICVPWMIRNANTFGRFSLTSISDTNLYYYNAASLEAHLTKRSLSEVRDNLADQLEETPQPEGDRWPAAREAAIARDIILENPLAFLWYNGIDALNGLRPGFSFLLSLFGSNEDIDQTIQTFMRGDAASIFDATRSQAGLILLLEGYMLLYIVTLLIAHVAGVGLLQNRRRLAGRCRIRPVRPSRRPRNCAGRHGADTDRAGPGHQSRQYRPGCRGG